MANPWVHGAVHLWLGFPSAFSPSGAGSYTPWYLGTGERAPRVRRQRRFKPLGNDLGGDEDFDVSYQGSSAVVTVRLTRWNESVLLAAENILGPTPGTDVGGFDIPGDIGSLMVYEQLAMQLWCLYSYAPAGTAPQPAFASMRSGWHFLAAWLGDNDEHSGGTDPAAVDLTFVCKRTYVPSTGSFTLYDRNFSGLPAPN